VPFAQTKQEFSIALTLSYFIQSLTVVVPPRKSQTTWSYLLLSAWGVLDYEYHIYIPASKKYITS